MKLRIVNQLNVFNFQQHCYLAYQNSWTLDASDGRSTRNTRLGALDSLWTLDSGCFNLDSWCYTFNAGLWTLDTVVDCFRIESEPSFWFCLIKLLKLFRCESLRTLWSRLFCRDYWWRFHSLVIPFSKESVKVKTVSNINLSDTYTMLIHVSRKIQEMNRHYISFSN